MSMHRPPALWNRVVRLFAGLALFGVSMGVLVRAGLGVDPWNVLHQGIARLTGASLGAVVIAVSLLVLAAWIPLRQRPGWGTLANAVLVGLVVDLTLTWLPPAEHLATRVAFLVAAIALNAVATALYIGADFGAGPRDGLMTGFAARGWSIQRIRTIIEVSVLAVGWLLGGSVGLGTLAFALGIGPLVHRLLPVFDSRRPDRSVDDAATCASSPTAPARDHG